MRNNVSEPLNRPRAGRVLCERNMRSRLVIIGGVFRKDSSKVFRVERDQMISALVPDRPDQAFSIAVLPGRAERGGPIPDSHCSHTGLERSAKCSVIVTDEIFGRRVPRECFGNLPRQPLRRWVLGHRKPQQLPPAMAKNNKCEELPKGNRRNNDKINRCNLLHMIAKETLPGLQWPPLPRRHVDRNRRLRDIDAQLEQLTVDPGSAPQRILKTHPSDQVAHLFADPWSATARTGLPSPIRSVRRGVLEARTLTPLEPQDIALTNGGFSAISVAFRLLLDAGDEAIFCTPAWFSYEPMG